MFSESFTPIAKYSAKVASTRAVRTTRTLILADIFYDMRIAAVILLNGIILVNSYFTLISRDDNLITFLRNEPSPEN